MPPRRDLETIRAFYDERARARTRLKTYVWGPIGEEPFMVGLAPERTTGPVVHVVGSKPEGGAA